MVSCTVSQKKKKRTSPIYSNANYPEILRGEICDLDEIFGSLQRKN